MSIVRSLQVLPGHGGMDPATIFVAGQRSSNKIALLRGLTSHSSKSSISLEDQDCIQDSEPFSLQCDIAEHGLNYQVQFEDTCDDDTYLDMIPNSILEGKHAVLIIFDWADPSSMNIPLMVLKFALQKRKDLPICLIGCNIDLVSLEDLLFRRRTIEALKTFCTNVHSFDLPSCRTDQASISEIAVTATKKMLRSSLSCLHKSIHVDRSHQSDKRAIKGPAKSPSLPLSEASTQCNSPQTLNVLCSPVQRLRSPSPSRGTNLLLTESVFYRFQEEDESAHIRFVNGDDQKTPFSLTPEDGAEGPENLKMTCKKHEWRTLDNRVLFKIQKTSAIANWLGSVKEILSSLFFCSKRSKGNPAIH